MDNNLFNINLLTKEEEIKLELIDTQLGLIDRGLNLNFVKIKNQKFSLKK
jgi:hypothetical protein